MNNLQLKISLPGTDPLVWREVVVSPNVGLEELHLTTQILMSWEDSHLHLFKGKNNRVFDPEEDAYYQVELKKVLPRKGSKIWYVYDFGDNWEHLIEVVARVPENDLKTPYLVGGANAAPPEDCGGIPGYRYKIEILADPTHPEYEETMEWMTQPFDDPFDPYYFDLEDTALYLREVTEELLDDFPNELDGGFFGDEMDFTDIDHGRERKIDFAWLKKEHGIPLTEEHIRRTPKEIVDFLKIAEAENDPTPFLKEAERLNKKYSGEPNIHMALLAMYHYLGKETLAARLEKIMPDISPDDILFNLSFIMENPEKETFMKRIGKFPKPLKLTNLPPGKGGLYHVDEFLLFESLAIRYALDKKQLDDAVDRLDRLVLAGYLHNELRGIAFMIAGEQIQLVQSLLAEHQRNPDKPIPEPSAPVSPRTQEILEISRQDVLAIVQQFNSAGGEEKADDDYPGLSLAHSAQRQHEPYVAGKKIGRNDPCPCGSGKKYKKCCGR